MNCPGCGQGPLDQGAKYCPRCGVPVEVAAAFQARLQVRQDVRENAGKVIGIEIASVRGDVIAETVHQTQVYLLGGEGRTAGWRRFLTDATPPYRFLSPYTTRDQAIFHGRDAAIHELVGRIGEQPVLTVYGPEGVGKTSLLSAGVIPELTQCGAVVVRVAEYGRPLAQAAGEALASAREKMAVAVPEEKRLAAIVRSAIQSLNGTLVLVLDHFEQVLARDYSAEARAALVEELATTLEAVEPVDFRLVVVVDSLELVGRVRDRLPRLAESPFELELLTPDEALRAVKEPLAVLGYPDTYAGGLVEKRLVPDLQRLSADSAARVSPPHLQLVCHTLYRKASARRPPHIDGALYDELGGAEGILHRHLRETLATLGEQGALARQILEAMAFPGVGASLTAERLALDGATPEQRQAVLEQLVEKGLLEGHAVDGQSRYAFSSPVVREGVRLQAAPEVRRRYEAAEDLDRAWSQWLVRRQPALRSQLHYLAEANAYLRPKPDQLLLLLRSAVATEEPVHPWLERMRQEGRDVIRRIDRPEAEDGAGGESGSTLLKEAERLLGLDDDPPPAPLPAGGGDGPGRIAQSAVCCGDRVARRTAALALTAARDDPREALIPLGDALRRAHGAWLRWWRQAELRGTLADADAGIEEEVAQLGLPSRAGIGLWRAWRRVRRQGWRILVLSAGGALGAFLGLGILRFLIALLVGNNAAGAILYNYSYLGGLMGGALCLGLALAQALIQPVDRPHRPASRRTRLGQGLLTVGLGSLGFGLAHALLITLSNVRTITTRPLVVPLGFLFGLGMSLAVVDRLGERGRRTPRAWLWRTALAAAASVLTQAIFLLFPGKGVGIGLAWEQSFYEDLHLEKYWPALAQLFPRWPDYLGLVDAALVGAVLGVGMAVTLGWAGRSLARWRDLANRAGE